MDRRLREDIHREGSIPAIRLPIGLRLCCTRYTVRHGCLASVTNGPESHAIKEEKNYRQSGRSCKGRGSPAWTCYTWPEHRDPYYRHYEHHVLFVPLLGA